MKYFILLCAVLLCGVAQAHKASDSYLDLGSDNAGHVSGRWDIALRDLDVVLALDANNDHQLTWGEVNSRSQEIAGYAFSRLHLSEGGTACGSPQLNAPLAIEEHADGHYAVLQFALSCPLAGPLAVDYELFADVDALHRGIASIHSGDANAQTVVLTPGSGVQIVGAAEQGAWHAFASFVRDGIHHIATGYDHLLFLLSLLLPAALIREQQRWQPVPRWSQAFWDTAAVVTAFTLAHSITLALSALDVVRPPSRLVESLIATSVVLAALHNIWPLFNRGRWLLAFCFGLVHGFGFASALRDLPVGVGEKLLALAGFNVGVEIGQLGFVAGFLPLALLLRGHKAYYRYALQGGSVVIASVAFVWLVQRAFNLQLIPG
jgi:hypothetical protein